MCTKYIPLDRVLPCLSLSYTDVYGVHWTWCTRQVTRLVAIQRSVGGPSLTEHVRCINGHGIPDRIPREVTKRVSEAAPGMASAKAFREVYNYTPRVIYLLDMSSEA